MVALSYQLFDVDNHCTETEDCFSRWIEPEFREYAVHWEGPGPGRRHLVVGDRAPGVVMGAHRHHAPAGKEDWVVKPGSLRERLRRMKTELPAEEDDDLLMPPHRGFFDRDARLALMDEQGIEANLLYTNAPPVVEPYFDDPRILYANLRAFNRWVQDEWGFAYKGRIHMPAFLSMRDLDMACAELDRVIAEGCKAIYLRPGAAYGRSPGDPYFDPFWARLNEARVSVAYHQNEAGYNRLLAPEWGQSPDPSVFEQSAWQWFNTYGNVPIMGTLSALLYDNLFGRFPNVVVASVENGAGWLPYFMSYVDKARGLGRNGPWIGGPLRERPTAIARRHIVVTPYPEDDVASIIDAVGHEMMALGSDWPHAEGMEHPSEFQSLISHLPEGQQRWILRDNGMRLVGRT
jgi:predicted TIM-barrel fold metal-dependent hydrolase